MRDTNGFSTAVILGAATALLLSTSAMAGNGAVSYENQLKTEQRKAKQQEVEQPQAAPKPAASTSTAPMATPAGAVTAAPAAKTGDSDRAFALATRQQLVDCVEAAEDQVAGGKDAQLAAIAKRIAESQRKEIAELDKWLAAHPAK